MPDMGRRGAMARIKKTMYLDEVLVDLAEKQADALERKLPYIVESAMREMFKDQLPAGWKPGDDTKK